MKWNLYNLLERWGKGNKNYGLVLRFEEPVSWGKVKKLRDGITKLMEKEFPK